ncbi:MAG: hypothetical protein H0X24_20565 [Ktedonobacterales bacterium]|nr:hypothetical protein [Ktedonobacterales bacterium]
MSNFRFLDDTDAQRILGVDRLTFQELLSTKRLRAVSGAGTIQFFRAADVSRLRDELTAETATQAAASAAALASMPEAAPPKKPKKAQEPALRVHARMTADLRWYDISDADIQAWFDQLHPETYARRRGVAQFVQQRMAQIIALLDAGEARYGALAEGEEPAGRGGEAGDLIDEEDQNEGR